MPIASVRIEKGRNGRTKVLRGQAATCAKDEPKPSCPQPVIVDGKQQWYIDKILKWRKKCNKSQYLVSWQGYDESENTWQYQDELGDCLPAIREFEIATYGTSKIPEEKVADSEAPQHIDEEDSPELPMREIKLGELPPFPPMAEPMFMWGARWS